MIKKAIAILACLAITGCALLTEQEHDRWKAALEAQKAGRHDQAAEAFAEILSKHEKSEDPVLIPLRLAAAQSHFELKQLDKADALLGRVSGKPALTVQEKVDALCLSGWIDLLRARAFDVPSDTKQVHLKNARRHFHGLRKGHPETTHWILGYALTLYETGKCLGTRTHMDHAHSLLAQCAAQDPDNPMLALAYARAKQQLLGGSHPDAMQLLRKALEADRKALAGQTVYVELFNTIAPYPDQLTLTRTVSDGRQQGLIQFYFQQLSQCAEEPAATGAFWHKVKTFLKGYQESITLENHFQQGVAEARRLLMAPDFSPLAAARESFRTLNETGRMADALPALLTLTSYREARSAITGSLLSALSQKITDAINLEAMDQAEELLVQAFGLVNQADTPDAISWARKFQQLKTRSQCRREFCREKLQLRQNLPERSPEAVRHELAGLRDRFKQCTDSRDFEELSKELLATQGVVFQKALAAADQAARGNDTAGEEDQLNKALTLTQLKDFSHRREAILLRLAALHFREGLWKKTQQAITQLPSSGRSVQAWLLLGSALACEEKYSEALTVFARKDLSDDLLEDPRYAAAAGLTFSIKGEWGKALPLLETALDHEDKAAIPIPRDKLLSNLQASLIKALGRANTASARERALAERWLAAGRGNADLAHALGQHLLGKGEWSKACQYLQKAKAWGMPTDGELLTRLHALELDYAPLTAGMTWEYAQANGQRLVLSVEKDLGGGRFKVTFKVADATDTWAWARNGNLLYKYFGRGLAHCHILPVGLEQPLPSKPFPSAVYKINGQDWNARVVALNSTVTTPYQTFDNCLVVETRAPGASDPVRRYFAPGVGEVKVAYPEGQSDLNLVLVDFKTPASQAIETVEQELRK